MINRIPAILGTRRQFNWIKAGKPFEQRSPGATRLLVTDGNIIVGVGMIYEGVTHYSTLQYTDDPFSEWNISYKVYNTTFPRGEMVYDNGIFVCGGRGSGSSSSLSYPAIFTSPDGINWSYNIIPGTDYLGIASSIEFANGYWAFLEHYNSGSTYNNAYYSTNPSSSSWTKGFSGEYGKTYGVIRYGDDYWMITTYNQVYYLKNTYPAGSWSINTYPYTGSSFYSMEKGPNYWVGTTGYSYDQVMYATSPDATWILNTNVKLAYVTYLNGMWMGTYQGSFFTAEDPTGTWTNHGQISYGHQGGTYLTNFNTIIMFKDMYVGLCDNGEVYVAYIV